MSTELPSVCAGKGRSCSDEEPDPLCPKCMMLALSRSRSSCRYWRDVAADRLNMLDAKTRELAALRNAIETIRCVFIPRDKCTPMDTEVKQ